MDRAHPTTIDVSPDSLPEEIARKLAGLRYDRLRDIVGCLAIIMAGDSDQDGQRGRYHLSMRLHQAATGLRECRTALDQAWEICKPFETKTEKE